MTQARFAAIALSWLVLLTAACGRTQGTEEIIARLGHDGLSVDDLDAFLLAQPPASREVPPGADTERWTEGKLRRLALERLLAGEAAALESTVEARAGRLLTRARILETALSRELASALQPDEKATAARAAEMAERRRPQPILDFQHIYFRTDREESPAAVHARAARVAAEAQADADFQALARRHSDSADAAAGGMVRSVRPSDLDGVTRAALAALDEGGVSPLVETRTGLHLFRLVRRLEPEPPSDAQLREAARQALTQEGLREARASLLAELEQRIALQADELPWRIGETVVEAEVVDQLLGGGGEAQKRDLVELLLLAEEAAARGLETPDVSERLAEASRLSRLERVFNERRREFDALQGDEVLRPYYDAQPALFEAPEKVRVELIFVSQGRDSFATQKRLEGRLAELRTGLEFGDLAREISEHRSAGDGGDLGLMPVNALGRYGANVAAEVAELEPGEVSGPVYCTGRILTQSPDLLRGGFAVVRLAERIPSRPRSFEEAIEDVRRVYVAQHRGELDLRLQDKILDEAGFEILRLPELHELTG